MSEPTVESKPRVLMVDDSKVIRMAANKILGKDFDVVVAADGEEGWQQLLDDHSIHVVFTDLMMPVLDGLGLLDRIRASDDPGIQNLPVIMVTGADNSEEARETALNRGATDFLQKPFNSIDLQARARAHCNYQRESLALKKQITVDATTGLNNQQSFLEQLSKDLAFAHRHRQSVAIVIAEMPDFKSFFMQNGKVAAEAALSQAAHLVRECIRTEDSASRYTISTLAIGKLGLAAVAIHSTKPTSISIDKALAMITRGQGDLVAEHIPHLLQEIIPLLQQATPEQRWNLMKQID